MAIRCGTFIVVALQIAALTACESRFQDKDADALDASAAFSIEDRLSANDDLDRKLARIEDAAVRVRRLIQTFRRFQDPTAAGDNYTQLDFLLDLNEQLRKSPV